MKQYSINSIAKRRVKPAHVILVLIIIGFTIFILSAGLTYAYFANDIKTADALMNRTNTGLILLDDKGEPFFTFFDARATDYVELNNVSAHVKNALIAAEDREYYEHGGFSLRGITRAAYRNFMNNGVKEGGSTITQGLIKNSLLSPKKSFIRKYQEIILAVELNRRYDKDKILEMYLNSVYFGEGAFGIYDAAKTYFGKEPKDLSIAQSALLVGLLPAPSTLSPITNEPKAAMDRQLIVLNAMHRDKKINQEEYDSALAEKMEFKENLYPLNNSAPHFALFVRDQLLREFGEEKILRSGFKVKTTLNKEWQSFSESIVAQQVAKLAPNKVSNGAAVVIDPTNGHIKVMVGSHDWYNDKNGKFNMAIAPRQPGSSIKPLFYAAALDKRLITAATLLNDNPKKYPDGYAPKDYDGRFRGLVATRRALANSFNLPAVDMLDKLGVQNGIETGKNFGLTAFNSASPSNLGLSMVLGSPEVPLLEMTNAYAVFADKGEYLPATPYIEIYDKFDNKIEFNRPAKRRVISEDSAFLISHILADNNARAEMFGNVLNINKTASVKTGTSEFYRDSLTIGYTPSLVVGVWVGNNDNTQMDKVAGSIGAAPIWKTLILEFTKSKGDEKLTIPGGIVRGRACYLAPKQAEEKKEDNDDDDDDDDDENKDEQPKYISFQEYFIKGTEKAGCNTDVIKALEENQKKNEETRDDNNDDDNNEDSNDSDDSNDTNESSESNN